MLMTIVMMYMMIVSFNVNYVTLIWMMLDNVIIDNFVGGVRGVKWCRMYRYIMGIGV